MKYALAAAALVAAVSAQAITDIPSCALNCVIQGIGEVGCGMCSSLAGRYEFLALDTDPVLQALVTSSAAAPSPTP